MKIWAKHMINIGNTYEKSGTPWNTYKNVVENYGKISGTFAWETPGGRQGYLGMGQNL